MIGLYLRACRKLGVGVVLERLRRLAIDLGGTWGCESCGAVWPEVFPFMVEDELWEEVAGDASAHLCYRCFVNKMQAKIGRMPLPSDLTSAAINDPIWVGVELGRREMLEKRDRRG